MEASKVIEILENMKNNYEHQYNNEQELVPYEEETEALSIAIAMFGQGCTICNSDEIGKLLIMKEGNKEYLAFRGGNSKFPKENHAKFCPKCGRRNNRLVEG